MNAGNGPVPLRLYVGSVSAVLSSVVIDLPDPKIAGSFSECGPISKLLLKSAIANGTHRSKVVTPLTAKGDQLVTSPNNVNMLSSKKVMRTHLFIRGIVFSLHITKFSLLICERMRLIWVENDWSDLGSQSLLVKSKVCLNLSTLTSAFVFSIPFSIHFLKCWRGEFV